MKSELKVFHHQIACKRIVNHFIVFFFKLLNQNTTNNRKQNTFFSQSHYSTIIQLAISILQPFQIRQFDLFGALQMHNEERSQHYAWYRFAYSFSMSVKNWFKIQRWLGAYLCYKDFPNLDGYFPKSLSFIIKPDFNATFDFSHEQWTQKYFLRRRRRLIFIPTCTLKHS